MPRVSAAFFFTGAVIVLFGMGMGMHMGESGDFTLLPVHAHLNLLGWVTMALYGTFYALTRETLLPRLAWTNYILSLIGLTVMIPSLALYLAHGNDTKYVPGLVVGEVATVLGLLVFGYCVFRELARKRA
ncbi:MAG TPA: hypothetical protein VHC40_09585 [Rhizomicrobium sp.]|jgi:hypothetical protein|nr:hypothetical protein [Rhizomicrobium sp.]